MKHEVVAGSSRLAVWPAFAVPLLALLFVPINHDAIWQMWIGRQLFHGAEFGRDIIEVNPPLWFWIAAPLAGFGEFLGIASRYLVSGLFAASIALSLYLIPEKYRLPSLAAFAVLPLISFGQREHFTLIATAPYALLIAERLKGERPSHPLAIGLFAALGFALKPHFVIVPLALELLVRPRVRPETVALVVCAVLYAAAVLIFTPAYLTEVVPMVRTYYPYFVGIEGYFLFDAALILAVAGALLGRRRGSPDSRVLALTALAFLPAVILQAKGWNYQTIPVRGFLFLAIVAELMHQRKNPFADSLLVGSAILCFWPIGTYYNARIPELREHLKDLRPGTSVVAFASNPSFAWPTVDDYRMKWAGHQFCIWQASAAVKNPRLLPGVRTAILADLAGKPDIVIVDTRAYIRPTIQAAVPDFPGPHYRLRRKTPLIETYERVK